MQKRKLATLILSVTILAGLCHAQPTQLGIDRSAGPSRINVQGETNRDYSVFGANVLTGNWTFLSTLAFSNNAAQNWFDSASASLPSRFYRALKVDFYTNIIPGIITNIYRSKPEIADDFRLIDHQGISRSLAYYDYDASLSITNVKAVVLIFTGNGCSNVASMVSTINTLRTNFTPKGVLFWMVDGNPADNRSNIVTEAAALGITNIPILHDRAQLVTRAYHATTTPEAVGVSTLGRSIFYRGTIDDRIGSSPVPTTQNYLSNALTSFLAGGMVSPRQTQTNGCAITLNTIPTPSYSTDIAPLLMNKCVRCHSPGNIIVPFEMTDYDTVSNNAPLMRTEVLAGRMPPWHADPFYQSFTNDISLTTTQAAMLVKWIDDGAQRGGGPDPLATAPPQTNYPHAWPAEFGTPDIIVPVGTQTFTTNGTIGYRTVFVPYTGPTAWLRAAVILPGTIPVVHHIAAGTGVDDVLHSWMSLYVPGVQAAAFPANTGRLLTSGTTLGFQLHYTADGTNTSDSSLLGLYTNATAPAYPLTQTSVAATSGWSIPANTNDWQVVRTNAAFTTNVWLYEVYPHMHTRGVRAKYEAIYTNGTTEVLLSVPGYDFHWQTFYRFAQPKYLPAGTKIRYTCAWDNSVMNKELMEVFTDPNNVDAPLYDPNRTVVWGEQTYDEMFIGYYNYSVAP